MIPLFDLHADTLGEMYKKKELLTKNNLHISLEKAKIFEPYVQIMAIWSDFRLSNEDAYGNFYKTLEYSRLQGLKFATKRDEIKNGALILGVEDARLINGNIERLDKLYQSGVRVLTLNWRGESIIGGGWDTNCGLTSFGKEALFRAFSLGIIPDISHSSVKASYEAIDYASSQKTPIIASHSNSFSVYSHKRNLSDEIFCKIKDLGGLVGISLAPEHLAENASLFSPLNHIYHYLSLGGEDTVCLGCDFDGVSALPTGISDVSSLSLLYFELENELGRDIANKIFYKNAYNFFQKAF